MRPVAIVALSALTVVSAQYTIDPNEVSLATRGTWCVAETNNCQNLCGATPATANSCDPTTLNYTCTCANGSAPGLQYYTGTLPTFICEQAQSDCITANENNQAGQTNCTQSIGNHCGKLDPAKVASSSPPSTTSAAGAATGPTSSTTGGATAAVTSTPANGGAMPTSVGMIGNGVAALAVGLFAFML